jgi:hypothetical protein
MKKKLTGGMILMAMILPVGIEDSAAGNHETVIVSANVLPKLSQTTLRQPMDLAVTRQDIAKGYIDINEGSLLHVATNDPDGYYLNFFIEGRLIQSADVKIDGRIVSVQAGTGFIHQPLPGRSGGTVEISYRLFLTPELDPGSYPWPIMVAASLM